MKKLLLLAAIMGCVTTHAQQIFSGSDYIYKYQMSVGKTNATPIVPNLTNPSAWLEIGKDSTNKGVIIPRIIDTNAISSPVKGLMAYVIPEAAVYYRTSTKWERISAGGSLTNYVKISDSTVYYYPLNSNPKGYLTAESDPIALNKTIDINQGPGIFVGGLLQTINNNPAFTISADNTTALWNANSLRGIDISAATPTTGQVLQFNGLNYAPATIGSAGTVTSVGLSLPSDIYTITNSPVTSSGTLTGAFKNQLANTFWAAPNGITGPPSFRAIANNDLPTSGVVAGIYGSDTTSAKVTVNDRGITTTVINTPLRRAVADGATEGIASFTASDFNSSSGNISIDYTNGQAASGSSKGFITASDWNIFNGKIGSLGGLTGVAQTFATGTTGTNFNISSSGTTHTFNLPDASAANRGVVTTGAQAFAGVKTFNAATVFPGNGTPAAGKIPIGTDASGNWSWSLPNSELIAVLDNIDILTANTYTLIPAVSGKRIIVTFAVYEQRSSTGSGTQTFTPTAGTNGAAYDNLLTTGSGGNFNSASAGGQYTGFLTPQVTQSIDSNPVVLKIVPGPAVLTSARIRVFVRYALLDL